MLRDIPQQEPWTQANKGDLLGNIWSSRNLDFKREPGFVYPSFKSIVTTLDTTDTTFTPAEDGTVTWGSTKNGLLAGAYLQPASSGVPPTLQASWEVSGTSTNTLTKSITIPSGSNQVLVLIPMAGDTVSATVNSLDSVVYNSSESGVSKASGSTSCGNNVRVRWGIMYIVAPTQTTADVVATWSASNPNVSLQILLFSDAKQTTPLASSAFVSTTTGGANSLNFDSGGDPISSVADSPFIQACMSSSTSHTHSEYGATEVFNTTVGTMRYSSAILGSNVYDNPQSVITGFAKETGTVSSFDTMRWWGLSDTSIYQTSSAKGDFDIDDASIPSFTNANAEGDIKAFNSRVYIAVDDTLYRRSGSSYTTVSTSLPNSYKILENYNGRLYIASDTQIDSINDSTSEVFNVSDVDGVTPAHFIDISSAANENLSISCMRKTSQGLWIGTYNNQGGRAKMMFWNGISTSEIEVIIEIESGMVMAMSILNDVPYILDNRGILSAFNGSYFEEVGRIDLDYKQLYNFDVFSSLNRWIHHNGMQTIDGEILMAINTRMADTTDTQIPRTPSGIYAYNKDVGVYHKFALGAQQDSATVTDMGQLELVEIGAIYPLLDDDDLDTNTKQSDFLVSYAYKEDNSTTRYAVAKSDKRGLDLNSASRASAATITFTKWFASEVKENWEKFYAFFKPLVNSTDKIVLKYRQQEYEPVDIDITWIEEDLISFNSSTFAEIKTNFDKGIEYEMEVLQGKGAGLVSQIESITYYSGTLYEVQLKDANTITYNGDTAKVRFDAWKLAGTFTDAEELESYAEFNPEISSTWIQYKLYLEGESIELQRVLSKSSPTQEI